MRTYGELPCTHMSLTWHEMLCSNSEHAPAIQIAHADWDLFLAVMVGIVIVGKMSATRGMLMAAPLRYSLARDCVWCWQGMTGVGKLE